MAVEKIGSTTHSAEVAVVAVKVSLGWVILKEVAFEATVLTKRSPTLNAGRLDRLSCTTQGADDLAHVLSIQAVPLASILRDIMLSVRARMRTNLQVCYSWEQAHTTTSCQPGGNPHC